MQSETIRLEVMRGRLRRSLLLANAIVGAGRGGIDHLGGRGPAGGDASGQVIPARSSPIPNELRGVFNGIGCGGEGVPTQGELVVVRVVARAADGNRRRRWWGKDEGELFLAVQVL